MQIPPLFSPLFGTDGIRGKANQPPLTPETTFHLGRALAYFYQEKESYPVNHPTIVVGRDTRRSGTMLEAALVAGINSIGVHALLLGVIPTPGVALLTQKEKAIAGVMISASHNPAADNGLKVFASDGYKPSDHDQEEIERLIVGPEIKTLYPTGSKIGITQHHQDPLTPYLEAALATVPGLSLKGMYIVVDAANGAAYQTTADALRKLGAAVTLYHDLPNGDNINERCGSTFPKEIAHLTVANQADLGISHDGDADRLILCDETGTLLDGDEIMAMIAIDRLKRGELQKNTLVTTVMSNSALEPTLEAHGGHVVRTQVGDRHVITAMRQGGYSLGGEQSGHLIFGEVSTTGDGLIAALQVLRFLKQQGQPLSELKQVLKKYPQIHRNIIVKEKLPLEEFPTIEKKRHEIETQLASQGRLHLRYSGTEPLLRLLLEGPDLPFLEQAADELVATLQEALS